MYVSRSRRWLRSCSHGFWVVAFAYFVSMAFSTVPSPLYVIYMQHDGLSELAITVIFAVYAAGVMVSLFITGHLSDWLGRRPVLLAALSLNAVVGVLFLAGSSLVELLIARTLCGVAVGMVTGTATAYLAELHSGAQPSRNRDHSNMVSSATPMAGLGAGALIAGACAQYAPFPLHTPYIVFIFLLIIAAAAVRSAPETVSQPKKWSAYRIRRIKIPRHAQTRFFAAAGSALAAFAVLALFSSVAPAFMAGTLHLQSHALAGLVAFLVFASAACAPLALFGTKLRQQIVIGLWSMVSGLVLLMAGVWLANFSIFLLAGVVVGAGAGILFKGCISTVVSAAPAAARAETLAGLFLTAYIGLSVPIISLGLASLYVSTVTGLIGFALIFLAVVLLAWRRLVPRRNKTAVSSKASAAVAAAVFSPRRALDLTPGGHAKPGHQSPAPLVNRMG